jgi:hypothetical protein
VRAPRRLDLREERRARGIARLCALATAASRASSGRVPQ